MALIFQFKKKLKKKTIKIQFGWYHPYNDRYRRGSQRAKKKPIF